MIVSGLFDLMYNLFDFLTSFISLPNLPESVSGLFNQFLGYCEMGISILSCYVDIGFLVSLFVMVYSVEGAILGYKTVMFILKKIPLAGLD